MFKESDKGEESERQGARKPELGLSSGGGTDDRTGESALAKEFAHRALAPLITDLRNRNGQLEGRRVAGAVGLTMPQLAECLEISIESLQQSPPPPGLEARLEPFAMVVGIVRDVYGGDDKRVRTWLRTPRPELDGQNPIDAMCVPSGIQRVINFVVGAWLRNAD
jgi:Protein of unknown function (DUF2384)